MNHSHQRSPLPVLNSKTTRLQIFFHSIDSKIRIRMSPAEEEIEQFEVHAARFFNEETAVWSQHTFDLIDHFAPFRDMMQDAEDDHYIFAPIGKLMQVRCVLHKELILWISSAGFFDLFFHHIQPGITTRGSLIQQICAVPVSTTYLQNILVPNIQPHSLKEWNFEMFLSPPAPPRVHGTKFDVRKFHKKILPRFINERGN